MQETTKDPKVEGSRSQQRSVTDHPPLSDCTEKISVLYQKNPRVRKILVRDSGAGNGCANFMDTWKKSVRSAGKAMSIKFLVFKGGGVFWVWGGGSADFIFMGARIFLI